MRKLNYNAWTAISLSLTIALTPACYALGGIGTGGLGNGLGTILGGTGGTTGGATGGSGSSAGVGGLINGVLGGGSGGGAGGGLGGAINGIVGGGSGATGGAGAGSITVNGLINTLLPGGSMAGSGISPGAVINALTGQGAQIRGSISPNISFSIVTPDGVSVGALSSQLINTTHGSLLSETGSGNITIDPALLAKLKKANPALNSIVNTGRAPQLQLVKINNVVHLVAIADNQSVTDINTTAKLLNRQLNTLPDGSIAAIQRADDRVDGAERNIAQSTYRTVDQVTGRIEPVWNGLNRTVSTQVGQIVPNGRQVLNQATTETRYVGNALIPRGEVSNALGLVRQDIINNQQRTVSVAQYAGQEFREQGRFVANQRAPISNRVAAVVSDGLNETRGLPQAVQVLTKIPAITSGGQALPGYLQTETSTLVRNGVPIERRIDQTVSQIPVSTFNTLAQPIDAVNQPRIIQLAAVPQPFVKGVEAVPSNLTQAIRSADNPVNPGIPNPNIGKIGLPGTFPVSMTLNLNDLATTLGGVNTLIQRVETLPSTPLISDDLGRVRQDVQTLLPLIQLPGNLGNPMGLPVPRLIVLTPDIEILLGNLNRDLTRLQQRVGGSPAVPRVSTTLPKLNIPKVVNRIPGIPPINVNLPEPNLSKIVIGLPGLPPINRMPPGPGPNGPNDGKGEPTPIPQILSSNNFLSIQANGNTNLNTPNTLLASNVAGYLFNLTAEPLAADDQDCNCDIIGPRYTLANGSAIGHLLSQNKAKCRVQLKRKRPEQIFLNQ